MTTDMKKLCVALAAGAASLFAVSIAAAAELTVMDQRGLKRAVREVAGPADIRFKIKGGDQLTLINVDGLQPEAKAVREGDQVVVRDVAPGVWQVRGDVTVIGVEIVPGKP